MKSTPAALAKPVEPTTPERAADRSPRTSPESAAKTAAPTKRALPAAAGPVDPAKTAEKLRCNENACAQLEAKQHRVDFEAARAAAAALEAQRAAFEAERQRALAEALA